MFEKSQRVISACLRVRFILRSSAAQRGKPRLEVVYAD